MHRDVACTSQVYPTDSNNYVDNVCQKYISEQLSWINTKWQKIGSWQKAEIFLATALKSVDKYRDTHNR